MNIKIWLERFAARAGLSGRCRRTKRLHGGKLSAAALLPVSLAVIVMARCGGSSNPAPAPTPQNGALYTYVGDTPACDVLAFSLFITEMDLHKQGTSSTSKVVAFPTSVSPISPVVEISTLRGSSTLANVASVAPGTYDQAILTLTVDAAAIYDPTQTPPSSLFKANISTTNVTVNIQPALVITSGKIAALRLDYNMLESLAVDAQGQLTGGVTPVFRAGPINASGPDGFGEIDNLSGFVRSVTTISPGTGFTSSLLVQTLGGRGPALNVNFTDSTQLLGASRIDQIPTGTFVEVNAFVDSNGNVVAKAVQVEDAESLTQNMLAYIGQVLSVTKDANGNATQFDMLVRETEPDDSTDIAVDTPVSVNISPSTVFGVYSLSSDLMNLASAGNLTFDPATLTPGQEVVAHGVFTKPASGLVSVAADKVFQRLQAVQGSFSSLLNVGSDNKTGGFQFVPCASLVKGTPFIVVTDSQTNFVNTTGLSSLTPSLPLLVRGLSFLDLQGGTINGVTIPAGTMVILAKQVQPL